jgi:predicted nuclease with TOPRIM domain
MVWVFKTRAQEPHKELEKRVSNLEAEVSKLDEKIYDEDVKIKDVEDATRLLLESTRALLSNLINNNPEDIEAAYKKLNAFLINR